jgi:hypothetical protein
VLIGCVQEASERRTWCKLCLGSGVHDVSALAKWEEVLLWRLNAIKQFVRRDGSQAGVIWCMARGDVEFVDGIEGSARPQSFR